MMANRVPVSHVLSSVGHYLVLGQELRSCMQAVYSLVIKLRLLTFTPPFIGIMPDLGLFIVPPE